jgi:hypothetical protein
MNKSTLLDLCDKSIVPAVKWNSIGSFEAQINVLIIKHLLENYGDEFTFKINSIHEDGFYIVWERADVVSLSLQISDFIPKDWKESQFVDILSHRVISKSPITNDTYWLPHEKIVDESNGKDWY